MTPTRLPLIQRPTPVHRLDRLSEILCIDLWIKRDDLTGFAFGGNKGRKLEYLMAEAVARRAEVVVSCGALQSNFVRQLGAACSMVGMRCVAVVMELPFEPEYGKPKGAGLAESGGNVVLDGLLDVETRLFPDGSWDELFERTKEAAESLRSSGLRVYEIPIGGSSPLGAYGFFQAAAELKEQPTPFDQIVTASSSGSTQAGLAYGFHGSGTRVMGVSCDPEPDLFDTLASLCQGLDEITGDSVNLGPKDFDLRFEWVGPGYGVPSEASLEAIRSMARHEGIFLDPIYSGKAFAGLTAMAAAGDLQGRVLFWHTGGTPTVFATPGLSEKPSS